MPLPEPLVPPECTMAGNDWFPLHFDRLRKSRWWRRATDLARARNVMLWGEAYKQVPGGSMPDDDDDLAEAAGFGMEVEAFIAAKAEIMAPWVLCSDGRWYHPTVCEVVLEAWEKASERRKSAALKKAAQRAKVRGRDPKPPSVPPEAGVVPRDQEHVTEDTAKNGGDNTTHNRQDSTDRTDPLFPPVEEDEPDEVQVAFDLWNETAAACDLPKAKGLDAARRKTLRARLADAGLEGWAQAMRAVRVSAFLRGQRPGSDGRAFKAHLDFVCQASSFRKLIEGVYGEDIAESRPADEGDALTRPTETRQRLWMQDFKASPRDWREHERGPKPGEPGCRVTPEIQREFGIEPAKPQSVDRSAA